MQCVSRFTITDLGDMTDCTHGCQRPHWPSTFSKAVFITHSPRWHHRPALQGVPSAQGMYCVRQPDSSPMSVVHQSRLHTGYKKCRKLLLIDATLHLLPQSTSPIFLVVNLTKTECVYLHRILFTDNTSHDCPVYSKYISFTECLQAKFIGA
jgi:hypothetical protein